MIAYETGASALLLHLSGTLPVPFRGTVYQFPISIWVPYTYPREAPLVYVTPTPGMMIRPGQHVSGEGRVYHPYIAGWATFWDVSRHCEVHWREQLGLSSSYLLYIKSSVQSRFAVANRTMVSRNQILSTFCLYSRMSLPRSHLLYPSNSKDSR